MSEIHKTIQDAVNCLECELNYRISTGLIDEIRYGQSIVREYAEVETEDDEYYEVILEVKYDEWGGGHAPDDDTWGMSVSSVNLYIDGKYEDPKKYGITNDTFQQ